MVSTRNHPKNFPPPDLSPSKSPPSTTSKSPSPRSPSGGGATPSSSSSSTRRRSSRKGSWAHAPSIVTVLWLLLSLPLVAWDTGYIFLRPHSMPGGKYHWPVYSPYALYGSVDFIYGFPAWDARNGFTAAQAALNVVESAMYVAYLVLVLTRGEFVGSSSSSRRSSVNKKGLFAARVVDGKEGALAVLLGLSAAVMTVSKTVLYWANEVFSGFSGIGHNDMMRLVFLWIIPNGLWLIFPTYMIYLFWNEILEGLAIASGDTKTSLLAIKDE